MKKIIIIEPQNESLFHAPFNAALLHSFKLAFQDHEISFTGMIKHVNVVTNILTKNSPIDGYRVITHILLPPKTQKKIDRFLWSWRLFSKLSKEYDILVLASASRMHLAQLQALTFISKKPSIYVVLHGELESIYNLNNKFPQSLLSLKSLLKREGAKRLNYFVLGDSLMKNIPSEYKHLIKNSFVIDHPYHFSNTLSPLDASPTLTFGIFGNSGDGELLYQLVNKVHSTLPNIKFMMIGFVGEGKSKGPLADHVEGLTETPLSREAYESAANKISHALFITELNGYKLRASGTFFDALSFLKPLLFISNNFVNHYWSECPPIGTKCTDIDEMANKIIEIYKNFNETSYREQQKAMQTYRARFTPTSQAQKIHKNLNTY